MIIRKLVSEPKLLVTIPELSEFMSFPWNDQVIDKGSSPSETLHNICALEPSSKIFGPKVIGVILGGTGIEKKGRMKNSAPILYL